MSVDGGVRVRALITARGMRYGQEYTLPDEDWVWQWLGLGLLDLVEEPYDPPVQVDPQPTVQVDAAENVTDAFPPWWQGGHG